MRVRSMSYVQSERKWAVHKVFNVTISPEVTEYLGCKIHVAKNNTCGWIGQPHLYKNLE